MAKPLRHITGKKSSKVETPDLKDLVMSPEGNKATLDFAAKHKIEKHDHPVATDDQFVSKKGSAPYKKQDAKVYEAACNHTNEGVLCEVHGEAACPSDDDKNMKGKKLLLDKKKSVSEGIRPMTRKDTAYKDTPRRLSNVYPKSFRQPGTPSKADLTATSQKLSAGVKVTKLPPGKAKGIKEEAVYLDEVLTAKDPVSKWIHDFVHSDNPKFKDKSVKQRQQMALGAYYSAKRGKSKNEQADTAITMPGTMSATSGGTADARV